LAAMAAKVFGALGDQQINVISIAQGSSEFNLSLVVEAREADGAVRAIHRQFDLGQEPSNEP
jgi:aspartokinase/homoserine dehydrogenase 1